jgi:hypothetical protein
MSPHEETEHQVSKHSHLKTQSQHNKSDNHTYKIYSDRSTENNQFRQRIDKSADRHQ